MDLEEKNKEKRKHQPLTRSEWLTFFFFPFFKGHNLLETNTFNETEEKRFAKFGFNRKQKESEDARGYGYLFYLLIFLIIMSIIIIN